MLSLKEVKEHLISNTNIEAKGANFTYGIISYYGFKNPKWGSACNVVHFIPSTSSQGRFMLLSEFKTTFCDEKWSLSEAEPILFEDDSYIITNLTKEEIDYTQHYLFRDHSLKKGWT